MIGTNKHAPTRAIHRARGRWRALLATAGIVAVALGTAVVPMTAPSAHAASAGAGYRSGAGDWLGSYSAGGAYLYCLEPGKSEPVGTSTEVGLQQWTANPDDAARINWAISTHGQTSDPNMAAAVHLFVWSVAAPAEYNSHGQSGDTWYVYRAPASQRNAILANLNEIRAQSAGVFASSPAGAGGSLVLSVDRDDHYKGTLSVSVPTSTAGTVRLTNAVFTSTGSSIAEGVVDGTVLAIRGVAPADGTPYRVGASGDWPRDGFVANLNIYSSGPGQQILAGPGERSTSIHLEGLDPISRTTLFAPVLSSQVAERYPAAGEPFTDTFRFDVAADAATGLRNSWPRNAVGEYAPITAHVTVYATQEAGITVGEVPADARPFAEFDVTTSTADGPTVPYTVTTEELVETGYQYVAVSTIEFASQHPLVQPYLPADYAWTDGWGVASEIATVAPTGRSQATPLQALGLPVVDVANVEGLIFDGAQVRFHAYQRPASDEPLFVSDDPEAVDPAAVCTPENRVYSSELQPASAVTTSPAVTSLPVGVVDWVFEILDADGVAVWTAPCGPVSERTVVERVLVETLAQTDVLPSDPVHDTATVWGTVEAGDGIAFAAYRQAFDDGGNPVCTADNRVWAGDRQPLTPGVVDGLEVDSGDTRLKPGTYWWVETYTDADGEVVHEGACGLENETTLVNVPKLATTGADDQLALVFAGIAAAALLLGIVALIVVQPRRSRRTSPTHRADPAGD